jgi:hypothetical protein
MLKLGAMATAALMIFAGPALAQQPGAAPATPAEPAASPAAQAPVDAELQKFARALLDIDQLRKAPSGLTQEAMLSAVQKSGIEPAKFNEFSNRMRSDAAFNETVQKAVHEIQAQQAAQPQGAAG